MEAVLFLLVLLGFPAFLLLWGAVVNSRKKAVDAPESLFHDMLANLVDDVDGWESLGRTDVLRIGLKHAASGVEVHMDTIGLSNFKVKVGEVHEALSAKSQRQCERLLTAWREREEERTALALLASMNDAYRRMNSIN